tara:strand:+ start:1433 stop:2632 length:1200 start_codon:yes stop_codon:yes gene_type:complete
MKRLAKGIFPTIIALSALSVSASAAFYSVSGLSKLFAGASTEVIIMAGSLEVSKLVIASLLYNYWDTLNKALRTYLTVATVVLVLITSMGIYGFLSAAYQDTYRQLSVKENQTKFLTQKKDFYEKDVVRYDSELERISSNISTLSNAKSSSIQVKDTSVVGGFRTTISTSEIRIASKRIEVEENNRKAVQEKRVVAADSLQKFQFQILELENNTEVAGELGPLQYLSGLTEIPMDKIINVLLLIIIFVFDPLAIALVVAANFAFDQAYRKNLYGELEDEIEPDKKHADLWNDLNADPYANPEVGTDFDEEIETYMDSTIHPPAPKAPINNEKEVVAPPPAEEEWKTLNEDDSEITAPKEVKQVLQRAPSRRRVLFTDGTEGWVSNDSTDLNDENKITYM